MPAGNYPHGAHPRAGGENRAASRRSHHQYGSSPRGRGKLDRRREALPQRRLIPARAGKTSRVTALTNGQGAHPRAGGENRVAGFRSDLEWGSSPRGRGKHLSHAGYTHAFRLIPARAGKTSTGSVLLVVARAHPRAGGENWLRTALSFKRAGSSPRGRGKHHG